MEDFPFNHLLNAHELRFLTGFFKCIFIFIAINYEAYVWIILVAFVEYQNNLD